jgi:hypothetical protein
MLIEADVGAEITMEGHQTREGSAPAILHLAHHQENSIDM